MTNSFKPEIQAGDNKWTGNGIRCPTREEAKAYVLHLMDRWMSVTATRVVESDDLPTYNWVEGKGPVPIKPGDVP